MKTIPNRVRNTIRRIQFERNLAGKRLRRETVMYSIYTKDEIKADSSKRFAKLVPFIAGVGLPTVIVCPGGAYQFVSYNNEGADYAHAFNKLSYNVFMLAYRVSSHAKYPNVFEDLARAISFVKCHGEKFGTDTDNIILCGSSAGGHLCACFAAKYKTFEKPYLGKTYNLKPKALVLSYPVISLCEDTHEITCETLLGSDASYEVKKSLSVEYIAEKDYPPTFFWHCQGDKTVPVTNSIRLDLRLSNLGVKHRFIQYPKGGHGIGLGFASTARGWIYEADKFLKEVLESRD